MSDSTKEMTRETHSMCFERHLKCRMSAENKNRSSWLRSLRVCVKVRGNIGWCVISTRVSSCDAQDARQNAR